MKLEYCLFITVSMSKWRNPNTQAAVGQYRDTHRQALVILSAQHCITHDVMTRVKEPDIEAKIIFFVIGELVVCVYDFPTVVSPMLQGGILQHCTL